MLFEYNSIMNRYICMCSSKCVYRYVKYHPKSGMIFNNMIEEREEKFKCIGRFLMCPQKKIHYSNKYEIQHQANLH